MAEALEIVEVAAIDIGTAQVFWTPQSASRS
jgi:hypothetical protein